MIQQKPDGTWTAYCDHCGVDYYEDPFEADEVPYHAWDCKEGVETDMPLNWTNVENKNGGKFYYCEDCLILDDEDNYLLRAERKDLYKEKE